MLRSISWGQYLQMLLMALPAYYLIILALFFKKDLQHLLADLTPKMTKNKATSPELSPAANKTPKDSPHQHQHHLPPANALLNNPPLTCNAIKLKEVLKAHLTTQPTVASVPKEPES